MCRPDEYPPYEQDRCPGCGKDMDDPHEQHGEDCPIAAEREGARGIDR